MKYTYPLSYNYTNNPNITHVFMTCCWSSVTATNKFNFGGEHGEDFKYPELYRKLVNYYKLYKNEDNIYGIAKNNSST